MAEADTVVHSCPATCFEVATSESNKTQAVATAVTEATISTENVAAREPAHGAPIRSDSGYGGGETPGAFAVPSDGVSSAPSGLYQSKNQLRKRRRQERHERKKEFWKAKKKELKAQKRSQGLQSVRGGGDEESLSERRGATSEQNCYLERAERAAYREGETPLSAGCHAEAGEGLCDKRKPTRRAPRPSLCNLAGIEVPGMGDCCCRRTSNGQEVSAAGPNAKDSTPATASVHDKGMQTSNVPAAMLMSTAGSGCSRCPACLHGCVGIVIDCDFEHLQTEREVLSLAQQLMYSYGACRQHNKAVPELSCHTYVGSDCLRNSKRVEMCRVAECRRNLCLSEGNPLSECRHTMPGAEAAGERDGTSSQTAEQTHTPGEVPTQHREGITFSDFPLDSDSGNIDVSRPCQETEEKRVLPVCFSVTGVGPQLTAHLNAFQGFPRWQCEAYTQPFSELYLNRNPRQSTDSRAKRKESVRKVGSTPQPVAAANPNVMEGATETVEEPQIVYLSGDAETILEDLRPGYHYVIGGVVDRNRHKGLTFRKSKTEKVHAARLPIREYLGKELEGSTILTVNQVVEILLGYLSTRDWHAALVKTFPARKGKLDSKPL
ncbi:tRNA (guanine(9)-N(1))-methyltransferase [Toxoplasma gondii RUB]|uniref:tRNA (guanine(9)-N(1))-methyltransferase n=9 Tax=Toxoplasma gondii TaxID=5811 RepID=S7UU04_TOXGG|nr:tRNA (guanine(9)-N(1))-methyltransferase [Toxoplasma gondii GT1]KAF4639315.1 tRNA (guanine(9)-N(1))-methyltransferase [Toxoplasma gondii]KFG28685.1 tRNA (guanine(9)-N(1))-methyltransferase [Toxoplasma gondii p89]KFG44335.1 tRNA (guanine(9)-N(1))-methyltransferase [Toxoplasma gondii GAB2-2007-GAL-DOM2]KFG55915.1 tRNA (guanine(9)-N(1))-methyltransferase [Toxoplasma gondii FOU]KFG65908.1 tRNA (guanine(9)-N(1))-methyltransferase [Toxoplasma gondii RUB]KFH09512.1 tRNA (guanine(9)-N(1))-methyltr